MISDKNLPNLSSPGVDEQQTLQNQPVDDKGPGTVLADFETLDHDHLYRFTYKNRFGVLAHINHPYLDEPPFTSEVQIGEIGIKPGTTLTYLYDFGDNWQFEVQLEGIDPADPKVRRPKVLETHGEAPEQYPRWDE